MQKLDERKRELIDRIERGKINFFVGAGISKIAPANLPSGPELTSQLLQSWVSPNSTLSILQRYAQNGTLRLEVMMQIAHETFSDRGIILSPLLSFLATTPNCNHYLLAFALKNGCTVITTNFDVLIEIAYWNLYGLVPHVLIFADQFRDVAARGSLIKLHGSVAVLERKTEEELVVRDTRETVIAALDQVAKGLGDKKTLVLRSSLQQTPTLVWGYSCMDDFDIFPALSTKRRKAFWWVFFEQGRPLELLSEDGWNILASELYTRSHLEDAKRFEVRNVSAVTSGDDLKFWGDISSWVMSLNEHWCLIAQEKLETHVANAINTIRSFKKEISTQRPKAWEKQLLAARLLAQVGEWGDRMHSLYRAIYDSTDLPLDFRLRIRIEHADKTAPNDLTKASEILSMHHGDENASDDTRAYALAILSNIRRRQKQKDAGNLIQAALAIVQRGNVSEQTSHLVSHYQALLIHQDVAEEVRHLKSNDKLASEFLAKIEEGERLFINVGTFFKRQGLINYYAMSQNGLALLLIEKGRALKIVGEDEEANAVFEIAANMLLEDVAEVRMRYGFFRGVGQAFRNVALARQEQESFEGTLKALERSAYFYSMVKPVPSETDLFEVFYRQAETYVRMRKPNEALQPVLRWILQKRASSDWHDEARGLKVLAEALRSLGFQLDAGYAGKLILGIYRDVLSDKAKRHALKIRRFGPENARENLMFVLQLAEDLGKQAEKREAMELLKQLDTLCG